MPRILSKGVPSPRQPGSCVSYHLNQPKYFPPWGSLTHGNLSLRQVCSLLFFNSKHYAFKLCLFNEDTALPEVSYKLLMTPLSP